MKRRSFLARILSLAPLAALGRVFAASSPSPDRILELPRGDAFTDDAAILQQWIDNADPRHILELPPGEYRLSRPIDFRGKQVIIRGCTVHSHQSVTYSSKDGWGDFRNLGPGCVIENIHFKAS